MFKNYFKSSWRNLWKNKFYSAINIAGLAIGLAVGIMILLWTHDELSFDSFHKNAGDIYKINSHLGKGADESEDRRSDLPDRLTLSGPSEPHVERPVGRNTRGVDLERQHLARPLDVGKEVELGLLGHPLRTPHRVDQLDGTVRERGRVGDSLATLVSVPTEVDHEGMIAKPQRTSALAVEQ